MRVPARGDRETTMQYVLFGNALTEWAIAIFIGGAVCLALYGVHGFLLRRLRAFAETSTSYLDDLAINIMSRTHFLFILSMGVYAAMQWLVLPEKIATLLGRIAVAVMLVQAARWADAGLKGWLLHYRTQRAALDIASSTSTAALGFFARVVLWVVIFLMVLDNFGVNITTLVASLGIGGIAVALAMQNILGDLFGSLSIVLDKPFVVGDFIVIDDIAGTVEYIGLKSTRIASLSGQQVVFSNSDMLKSRIHNYKRMQTRRIVFEINVTREIDQRQLHLIPVILREAVEAQQQARFDRAHFKGYGAVSLDFEIVYFVETPDYNVYMDVQQEINFALFDRFAAEDIPFAYPVQTVRVANPEFSLGRGSVMVPAGELQH
jgi:small-conductance mechanosensitive channel